MINPILLVLFTVLAVVFFWICYETYERKGIDKTCAIIGIIPACRFCLNMYPRPGSYQVLYAIMVGIAVMCFIYLVGFWGRLLFGSRGKDIQE
jgi:TRAP-type C4-dicarboxylate transport system permease small subunit